MATASRCASAAEVQTVVGARRLATAPTVFIGVGRPSTAAILARSVHNPALVLVYESGAIGAKPFHIPLSIGDGELAETADTVVSGRGDRPPERTGIGGAQATDALRRLVVDGFTLVMHQAAIAHARPSPYDDAGAIGIGVG
jgi:hypothetical protein